MCGCIDDDGMGGFATLDEPGAPIERGLIEKGNTGLHPRYLPCYNKNTLTGSTVTRSSGWKKRDWMYRRGYLRKLISVGYSWIFVLWIYLSTGWRFWGWWFQQPYTAESIYTGMKQTLLLIRHGESTWNAER